MNKKDYQDKYTKLYGVAPDEELSVSKLRNAIIDREEELANNGKSTTPPSDVPPNMTEEELIKAEKEAEMKEYLDIEGVDYPEDTDYDRIKIIYEEYLAKKEEERRLAKEKKDKKSKKREEPKCKAIALLNDMVEVRPKAWQEVFLVSNSKNAGKEIFEAIEEYNKANNKSRVLVTIVEVVTHPDSFTTELEEVQDLLTDLEAERDGIMNKRKELVTEGRITDQGQYDLLTSELTKNALKLLDANTKMDEYVQRKRRFENL